MKDCESKILNLPFVPLEVFSLSVLWFYRFWRATQIQLHYAVHNMNRKPLDLFCQFLVECRVSRDHTGLHYDNFDTYVTLTPIKNYRADRQFTETATSRTEARKSLLCRKKKTMGKN